MAIDESEAAQRLARAILADTALYNRTKLTPGSDPRTVLAPQLGEGRALFHERVAPALHSIFERELEAFDFSAARRPRTAAVPPVVIVSILAALAVAVFLLLSR